MTDEALKSKVQWLEDKLERAIAKMHDLSEDLHNRARAGEAESSRQHDAHDNENLLQRVRDLEEQLRVLAERVDAVEQDLEGEENI